MQQSSAFSGRAQRLRQWLLSRRHVDASSKDAEQNTPSQHAAHRALLRSGAMALLGYALTRASLLFSVNPLPAALLIAAPSSLTATLFGVLFGLWQGAPHPSVTLLTVSVGWLLRMVLRLYAYPGGSAHADERLAYRRALLAHLSHTVRTLYRGEDGDHPPTASAAPPSQALPTSLRTLCALFGGVAGALWHCAHGGFTYYDLYGALLLLLLTPSACALFCFALDAEKAHQGALRPRMGQAALLCSVCFCLRASTFFGISLPVVLLLCLALYLVPRRGIGLALGALLLGGLSIDATVLPPMLLCVIIYTLLCRAARWLALPLATAAGLLGALAGGKVFFWQIAPCFCIAALIISMYTRISRRAAVSPERRASHYQHDAAFSSLRAEQARIEHLNARLCTMSGAFGGLCEVLLHMGDRLRYTASLAGDPVHAEAFAKDCSVMAGLLRDALAEDARTLHADDQRAEALGQLLRQEQFPFRQLVCLVGADRCRIELYGCSSAADAAVRERLHRLIEQQTGFALRTPICDTSAGENGVLVLQSRPRLSMQCMFRSLAAGMGLSDEPQAKAATKKVPGCGDSIRFFSDGQEHFFALLCDGMGSGEQAALTSGMSVLLLERMLRAGVGIDTALTMLNHYLFSRMGKSGESTTTVDLMMVDLFSGKARFIKSGAADTLLLRDGQLYAIGCRTFPLGALSGIDVQIVPFSLRHGDLILMMSDGIADVLESDSSLSAHASSDDEPTPEDNKAQNWLYDMLDTPPSDDSMETQLLLERILQTARQRGSPDDMTVALLRVVGE
ncbi:MAG: SpoIIE family protein phosphatase [Clostridia bacterium]|nr:SpoIIE family protein phosphatase [Clostridia bacterium]